MHKNLTFVILDSQLLFDFAYQSLDFSFFLNLYVQKQVNIGTTRQQYCFNFLLRQGLLIGQDR
ncbi:unnamed protein product [Brassica napus]|uniref:(rape) hypothetical protein n=1 Tax=Brassica napus TaxID=3708 RepID=A0A816IEZ5_BRANA|nr:unnamed protein product [Brassica napus]